MTKGEKVRAQKAVVAERRKKALELRKAGATYDDIGKQLGISKHAAYKHVMAALKEIREEVAEDARDVLRLELERLDYMQMRLWQQVQQGHNGAVDRVLRIMERRAKLLGIDNVQQTDTTVPKIEVVLSADRTDRAAE